MSGVDLDTVADELYGLWPADFTAARTDREQEARAAGDKELAKQIKALGKPTTVAWLANRLVRDHDDEVRPLLELGDALREATAVLRGEDLRRLSQQQHQLVSALVRQARRDAADAGHRVGEDAARGLEDTLRAALADADLAEQLAAGRLTGTLQRTGFAPSDGQPATPPPPSNVKAPTKLADRAAAKQDAARRKAEVAQAEKDLAEARAQSEQAAAEHEEAQTELEESGALAAQLAERADALRAELEQVSAEQASAERRHKSAGAALKAAERAVRVADRLVQDRTKRLDSLS